MTRKFGDRGGFVKLGFDNDNSVKEEEQNYFSSREIYNDLGELESTAIQDQYIDQDTREDEYSIDAGARLPFSKSLSLDLDYEYSKKNSTNSRLVYETNDNGETYEMLNDNLSNDFKSETFNHRPSLGLVFNNDKLRASISGGFQSIRLKNEDVFTQTSFDNTYNNFFGKAYLRYKLTKSQSIYFRYRNQRDTPGISQLQPATNTTNPLNVITGNPDLKPTSIHSIYANYNNYDYRTHSGFYAYLSGSLQQENVVSLTTTNEDLLRTTTYTNVDGAYKFSGGFTFNKTYKLKNANTLKPKVGLRTNFNHGVGFSNAEKYTSERLSLVPQIGIEYNLHDLLVINPTYDISFNHANYSLSGKSKENYINHNVGIDVTSYWPENLVFGNDVSYQYIGKVASGFNNSYVLWNVSLGYKVWGDDGIFKVKVFDLLDQNVSTSRFTEDDFIQDTQELVLEQYVMFSFTYKFSKFGGKNPNKNNGRHF